MKTSYNGRFALEKHKGLVLSLVGKFLFIVWVLGAILIDMGVIK